MLLSSSFSSSSSSSSSSSLIIFFPILNLFFSVLILTNWYQSFDSNYFTFILCWVFNIQDQPFCLCFCWVLKIRSRRWLTQSRFRYSQGRIASTIDTSRCMPCWKTKGYGHLSLANRQIPINHFLKNRRESSFANSLIVLFIF